MSIPAMSNCSCLRLSSIAFTNSFVSFASAMAIMSPYVALLLCHSVHFRLFATLCFWLQQNYFLYNTFCIFTKGCVFTPISLMCFTTNPTADLISFGSFCGMQHKAKICPCRVCNHLLTDPWQDIVQNIIICATISVISVKVFYSFSTFQDKHTDNSKTDRPDHVTIDASFMTVM